MEMKSECQEKVFANEDLGKTVYSVPKLIEFIIYMVIINHEHNVSTFFEKKKILNEINKLFSS